MRVVSLSPSLTEIIQYLGCEAQLAAITSDCPEDIQKPRLLSPKAISLADLDLFSKDTILFDEYEVAPELAQAIKKSFHTIAFDIRSIDHVSRCVSDLGRLLRSEEKANQLNTDIYHEVQLCKTENAGIQPIRFLTLIWNRPQLTTNFDHYISRMVELCGGFNVFHAEPLREFPVEIEQMIEKKPDLLILPKKPYPFQKRHISKLREYRVFSKCVIELVDGSFFSRFGPRTVVALQTIRQLVVSARQKVVVTKE